MRVTSNTAKWFSKMNARKRENALIDYSLFDFLVGVVEESYFVNRNDSPSSFQMLPYLLLRRQNAF